jgi:hypothetical protein
MYSGCSGVDAGDPDLDEVVEDRLEMAVAVVDAANVGLDGPGSPDDPGQPGRKNSRQVAG